MNKLTIIGNLTKDPELRTTQNGISVCSFTVAVNRRNKRENEPEADYFDVSVWREKGENCAKYLSKGKKVCVMGAVSCRTWESNGKHGASLEIKSADEVEFLSSSRSDTNHVPTDTERAAEESAAVPGGFTAVETDELPF